MLPVFAECGPYFRWMPPDDYSTSGPEAGVAVQKASAEKTRRKIVKAVEEEEGGEVVGVLGFSQGGRMAAGLMADQEEGRAYPGMPHFRFGVLLCASYPPYSMKNAGKSPADWPRGMDEHGMLNVPKGEVMITLPSVHVRGLLDQHLEKGRRLRKYFGGKSCVDLEFEMGHHLPQAAGDVASGGRKATNEIRDAIVEAWKEGQGDKWEEG